VTVTVNGNMTVTWNWLTQYLVTPSVSGPGSVTPAVPTWANAGGSLAVVAVPSAGASFQGWTGDTAAGTVSGNEFTIAPANRPVGPITANFSLLPRTLTVVSQYAGATPVTGQTVHPHGTLVNFSAAPVVSGAIRYVPTGWSLSGAVNQSGTGSQGTVTLNGDVTLEWVWSTEVLLEITPGVEGIVLPMNAAGWYPLGTAVTLEARPAPLFDFARWNGDVPSNSTNPVLSLVMNQPRKVTPDITPRKAARGTPWWWLAAHARVINGNYDAAELTDFDGDGQIAADEFLAGTDDLESSFRLQVSSLAWTGNPPKLRLVWTGAAGRQYDALWLAAPGSAPEPLVTGITGVDSEQSVDLTIAGSPLAGFVKLAVRPEPAASGVDADPVAYSHQPKSQSVRRKVRGIPGGLFTRGDNVFGSNASKPAHPVRVDPFVMDQFEVTREEWDRVAAWARLAENGGYDIPFGPELTYGVPGNHPVVGLKWYDAVKWCNARSEMEGRVPSYYADLNGTEVYRSGQLDLTNSQVNWAGNGYRLPTEAEWECASRGGLVGKQYPWGDENALFRAGHWDYWVAVGQPPEYPYTAPVGYWNGTQPGGAPDMANGFGLYDMAGNAWEWTWDRMSAYTAEMQVNPRGPDTGATRVQRGGAWWNYIDQATNAQRLPFPPNGVDDYGMNGFRCVRPYSPNELP
jgi:formylglycine-generating enzyme required for sulfatase activity